jgi:hypothetical protein
MFGWLNSFVRYFLAPFIAQLADRRIRELAEYAITAVRNMEFSELKGLARREVVMEALKREAKEMGLEIQDYVIAAILEASLVRVREK